MAEKIVILGSGESGVGAAILAQKQGMEVFVSDYGKIKPSYKEELAALQIAFEEGRHSEDIILSATTIIKSPGIADKTPIIQKIKEKNIPIISEIEFGYRFSKDNCYYRNKRKNHYHLFNFPYFRKSRIKRWLRRKYRNIFCTPSCRRR